jgi:hypothetical protein
VYIKNFHNSVIEYYRFLERKEQQQTNKPTKNGLLLLRIDFSFFLVRCLNAFKTPGAFFFLLLLSAYQIFICNIQDV